MLEYFKEHLIPSVGSPTFYPLALLLFGIIPVHLDPKPEIVGTTPFVAGIRRSYLVKSLVGLAGLKWILEATGHAGGFANNSVATGSLVTLLTCAVAYPLRKYAEGTPFSARPSKAFGLFWFIMAVAEFARGRTHVGTSSVYHYATQAMAGVSLLLGLLEIALLPREQATGDKLEDLEKRRALMSRRMTVFSKNMARGAFPKESNIPPPTIQTLLTFDEPPTLEELKDVLEKSVLKYYRFKSIPVQDAETGEWVWAPDEDFNLDDHIVVRSIDDEQDLVKYVEDMFDGQALFEQDKPRWNFHLVNNTGSGKSGVVINVSHILGDGLSFVRLALDMFTDKDGKSISFENKKKAGGARNQRDKSLLHSIASTAYLGYQVVASHARVAAETLGPGDSMTKIKDDFKNYSFNKERETVLVPPMRLDTIKQIKTKLGNGATINDVLTGALAGAFRRYLEYIGDESMKDPSKLRLRGMLPFSFPRSMGGTKEKEPDLHNNWCFISLPLPVNIDTPVGRVMEVNKEMTKIKNSADPLAAKNITILAQTVLPSAANAQASLETMTKHSCVWTNVPGFDETAYLAGHAIRGIFPIISNVRPPACSLLTLYQVIPQISALSYDGKINMNFVVDPTKFTEPVKLKEFFLQDLEELRAFTGVESSLLE